MEKYEIIDENDSWSVILAWGKDGAKSGMKYSKEYYRTKEDIENNMERIIQDYRYPNKWY